MAYCWNLVIDNDQNFGIAYPVRTTNRSQLFGSVKWVRELSIHTCIIMEQYWPFYTVLDQQFFKNCDGVLTYNRLSTT